MTIKHALQTAEEMRPNGILGAVKIGWLSELEGRIVNELYGGREEYSHIAFEGYPIDADTQTVLLVPDAYANVYVYWLLMKVDFANNETERFNNDAILFNTAYLAYANHINRTCAPMSKAQIKLS